MLTQNAVNKTNYLKFEQFPTCCEDQISVLVTDKNSKDQSDAEIHKTKDRRLHKVKLDFDPDMI